MAFLRGSSIYCITEKQIDHSRRVAFSSVCLVTSSVSVFGACTQLRAWYDEITNENSRRSIPLSNPRILFHLALADLLACIGVIGMAIIFICYDAPVSVGNEAKPAAMWYVYLGAPIETFTMFSYVATYMWTFAYAFDNYLQTDSNFPRFKMVFYHMIAWILPAWIVVCGQFGVIFASTRYCASGPLELLHYLVCYVPLLFTMVTVPILYFMTHRKVRRNIKRAHGIYTNTERQLGNAVRKKFLLICIVFGSCWIFNFVDGFHDLIQNSHAQDKEHFAFWMVEACINPLQGFLNCLVYGKQHQFRCCNCKTETSHASDPDSPTSSEPSSALFRDRDTNWRRNRDILDSTSFSRGVYDETSPLLTNTSLGTSPSGGPYRPFVARLLGEPMR